jgi:acetyl-CoA acetyltransferase
VFAVAAGFYDVVLVGGLEDMSKRTTEDVAEGLALSTLAFMTSRIDALNWAPGLSLALA